MLKAIYPPWSQVEVMDHPSLRYLQGEAAALDLEGSRIDQGLALGMPIEALAAECLQRAADRVGPLLSEEKFTLSAVLMEHNGAEPALAHEAAARQRLRADCEALEAALREGRDCEPCLEAYAADLHAYAAIERDDVHRAAIAAGDRVLREADFRVRAYGKQDVDVAVDADLWTATP